MFCYQCEQTFRMTGCVDVGVCGKDPATAGLQDLLIEVAKAVGTEAHAARQAGANLKGADVFVLEALFATGTNVNFDPERLASIVRRGAALVKTQQFPSATAAMLERAALAQIDRRIATAGPDITGLQELILYGLKGIAAYAEHARHLGKESDSIYASLHEALAFLARPNPTVEELLSMAMKAGEPRKGKAIVVSGHDLADLRELLEQTAGKSINVYTHGEMLPAHGYPELKKYPHLAGNYGGAWMDQGPEFDAFPGAILMTSNCIQQPRDNYKGRIFTAGPVAWPGVTHIAGRDSTPLIEAALAAPGFEKEGPDTRILVGFGRNAVLGAAGAVIEGVKSGAIRHFFLIGGCDGAKPGRNYYTEFAQSAPRDTIILTLARGKYRFNKLDFGTVAGLPRLLDIGQCNDAYSAIQIAVALANAFGCGVNDLPLSLVLSWYEQKAVAILLTLLHLGIRNIRLGPSLPAFVTPAVLKVLVDNYNILPIQTAGQDLAAILN